MAHPAGVHDQGFCSRPYLIEADLLFKISLNKDFKQTDRVGTILVHLKKVERWKSSASAPPIGSHPSSWMILIPIKAVEA